MFDFDDAELEGIAPLSVQADYLKLFNFTPPPVVTPYLPPAESARHSYPAYNHGAPQYHPSRQPPPVMSSAGTSQPETIFVNGKKKKRIQPVFVSHLSSAPGDSTLPTVGIHPPPSGYSGVQSLPPPLPLHPDSTRPSAPYSAHRMSHYGEPVRHAEPIDRFPVPPQVPISHHYRSSLPGGDVPYRHSSSREMGYTNGDARDSPMGFWEPEGPEGAQFTSLPRDDDIMLRVPRPRTLGGDRYEGHPIAVREIRPITVPMDTDAQEESSGPRIRLPIPPLRSIVSTKIEEREGDVFEGRNSENSSCTCRLT